LDENSPKIKIFLILFQVTNITNTQDLGLDLWSIRWYFEFTSLFFKRGFMRESKVCEGKLDNGLSYEIHIFEGFSGKAEVALKIENKVVSVISVEIKQRSGNIVCQPFAKRTVIKHEFKEENGIIPNLDDVLNKPQEQNPEA